MKHDPKIYNPKILRFMGWTPKTYKWPKGEHKTWADPTGFSTSNAHYQPIYHRSPADLQKVLVAICKKTGRTIQHNIFNFTNGVTHQVGIGLGIDATGDTFEQAAYSAICQWIDREGGQNVES